MTYLYNKESGATITCANRQAAINAIRGMSINWAIRDSLPSKPNRWIVVKAALDAIAFAILAYGLFYVL